MTISSSVCSCLGRLGISYHCGFPQELVALDLRTDLLFQLIDVCLNFHPLMCVTNRYMKWKYFKLIFF